MSGLEIVALFFAAIAAGIVNAIAGGGTLITFPTLVLFGTSTIVANATSTLALVIGTAGGIFGYRKQIAAVRQWLGYFIPVSLAGGLLGSYLLTRTSENMFSKLVPFLILFATVLFLAQNVVRKFAGHRAMVQHGHPSLWIAVLFQFAVAIYGGYFGAGAGILMLAALGLLGFANIHEMNGMKNILGSLINLVAATLFVFSGLIDWPKMGVMTGGAVAGYYIGAHYSQRLPQPILRGIITTIGFIMSAVTFWKQFH